jgi:hypothetical protein
VSAWGRIALAGAALAVGGVFRVASGGYESCAPTRARVRGATASQRVDRGLLARAGGPTPCLARKRSGAARRRQVALRRSRQQPKELSGHPSMCERVLGPG